MFRSNPINNACFFCCKGEKSPYIKTALIMILALGVAGLAMTRVQVTKAVVLTYTVLIGLICILTYSVLFKKLQRLSSNQEVTGIKNLGKKEIKDLDHTQEKFYIILQNNENEVVSVDMRVFPADTTDVYKLKQSLGNYFSIFDLRRIKLTYGEKELQDEPTLILGDQKAKNNRLKAKILYCTVY